MDTMTYNQTLMELDYNKNFGEAQLKSKQRNTMTSSVLIARFFDDVCMTNIDDDVMLVT